MMMDNPCEKVRTTCASFSSRVAWLDKEAAKVFADSIDIAKVVDFSTSAQGLSTNRFDELEFASEADEAGFILIAHALDFGSGFRPLLHKYRNNAGAWLTIRAGLVKMGTVNSSMNCSFLTSLTLGDIQAHFDLHNDELVPLAEYIKEDVFEIGTELLAQGFKTPGEFVVHHLDPDMSSGKGAEHLVRSLVELFPLTFSDEYIVNDQNVCFYKKAQLVVSEIHMRFPNMFAVSDTDNLTAFVDNVVVAMMRMTAVVKCCAELDDSITAGNLILKGSEEEVGLRSAALYAVEVIVSRCRERAQVEGANTHINAQIVCNWLWGCLGKDGENRKFPRHLAPSIEY